MMLSQSTAVRVLATAVTLLLTVAVVLMRGSFWPDFLVGTALGLSIGLLTLVWSKNAAEDEVRDRKKPIELDIAR